ncbi:MAG: hypothetical protein NXI24_04880 [bacterium]|nr:hypothetical protein [bacterium]
MKNPIYKSVSKSGLGLAVIILLLATANCKSTLGTGKFIATQELPDSKLERLSEEKIEGRGCRQHIFFVPVGEQSYNAAFADAMSRAPEGTTGFMSAEMETSFPLFAGLMFGRYCAVMRGYPARANIER